MGCHKSGNGQRKNSSRSGKLYFLSTEGEDGEWSSGILKSDVCSNHVIMALQFKLPYNILDADLSNYAHKLGDLHPSIHFGG